MTDPLISPIEADLEYLYSFGEWQDIPLVVDLIKRFNPAVGRSLLGGGDISREVQVLGVKTILKLGKNRLADVLALDCPSSIKRNIISSIKDREFVSFGDDVILGMLNNDDSEVRKHCVLKCAKTYSKTRLLAIFNKYSGADQIFYNVIHWFDFGLYSSKEQVKTVFRKISIL